MLIDGSRLDREKANEVPDTPPPITNTSVSEGSDDVDGVTDLAGGSVSVCRMVCRTDPWSPGLRGRRTLGACSGLHF